MCVNANGVVPYGCTLLGPELVVHRVSLLQLIGN